MKTKKVFHFIVLFLIYSVGWEPLGAQNPEWKVFTERPMVTCMAEEGPYIWLGTNHGLVRCDKDSGTSVRYDLAKQGLPSNMISSIAIDSSGNKWIGIGGQGEYDTGYSGFGLARFDGVSWNLFNTSNSGLQSNSISCLAIGQDGKTWIGSDRGLVSYDGGRWIVFDTSNSELPSTNITCLAVGTGNCIWVGTDSGLVQLVDTVLTAFTSENSGLPVKYIRCLALDTAGAVWAYGEKNGGLWGPVGKWLVRYNGTNWLAYSITGLDFSGIDCIVTDKNDMKWVVSTDGDLLKFDGFAWRFGSNDHFEKSYSNRFSLVVDTGRVKWVGTSKGLFKYDGESWTILPREAQLPTGNLLSVAIEGNRNVWVGTWGGGVAKFDGRQWVVFNESNSSLPSDCVQRVAVSSDGIVMMKTLNGVVTVEDTNWMTHGIHGIPFIDFGGSLWVAGMDTLFQFDGGTLSPCLMPDFHELGSTIGPISCALIDSVGRKWFGLWGGGLIELNNISCICHPLPFSAPSDSIFCLAEDRHGNIWAGTHIGLCRFDGVDWAFYTTVNSGLPSNSISCISIDESGSMWIGTIGAGMAKFDGAKWQVFNSSNSGLPSNSVSCIAIDGGGNKWIATNGGLAVFNETGIVMHEAEHQRETLPGSFVLYQNFPNPFNPTTEIRYQISELSNVSLKVYDVLGREVRTLVNRKQGPGTYEVRFDASGLASGVYFYRIEAMLINGEQQRIAKVKKLMLIK